MLLFLLIVVMAIVAVNAIGKGPIWPAVLIIGLWLFWSGMPK
jgi:hypothetical protein